MNRGKDLAEISKLIERYGGDRLVLFDYSDHGDGNYPCRVFAQNTKKHFPATVFSYLDPQWQKFQENRRLPVPERIESKYDFTFCGDITSHASRLNGKEACRELAGKFKCLFKFNEDGWVCLNDPQDDVYTDSFNTHLMWCPPSRRAITNRLLEAILAGVPVITNLSEFRSSPYLDGIISLLPEHALDGNGLASDVRTLLNQQTLEVRAREAQHKFEHYRNNFWQYVIAELNGEKIPA